MLLQTPVKIEVQNKEAKKYIVEQWLVEIQPNNFETKVLKCPELALVTFLRNGVASGDMLITVLGRFAQESKSSVVFFKVDVEQCSEIATRYRIHKIPMTLIFFKGEVVAHFFGVVNIRKIRDAIKAVLK